MQLKQLPDNAPRLTAALFHPRYWPQWFGQAVLWLVVQLPYPVLMYLGAGLGWLSMKLLPRRVRIARTNLQLAFPDWDDATREACLKENFANVGRAIFETGIAWFWPDWRVRKIMHVTGAEHVEQAVANKHGMLLLSAHFMTLELNAGQMIEDVKLAVSCAMPVELYNRQGGMLPSENEVLQHFMRTFAPECRKEA